jgi:predicted nucleic acid-binding protein
VATYYLDSSAMVKRYIEEPGSGWVRDLTDPAAGHILYTTALTGTELIAALVRRTRGGHLPAYAAIDGVASVRQDWRSLYTIADIDAHVVARAMDVAEQHGLRGYDAVHVATALMLRTQRRSAGLPLPTFVSADQEQLRAATAEGMAVEDPNQHT